MRWSQLYLEFIDNAVTDTMSDSEQLIWFKVLCLASQGQPEGTVDLKPRVICERIRISTETWDYALDKFRAKGMIEYSAEGLRICRWKASDQPKEDIQVSISGSIQISNLEN